MTTIRVAHRHRFTTVDRAALNDAALSFRARGVLVWLLDKPDDWRTTADVIAQAGKEGRDAIRAALTELEQASYLSRKKWRDSTGVWKSEWVVYEQPQTVGTKPGRETSAGYPLRITRPQLLNTEQNTELADPDCFDCHGTGVAYYPGAGVDGRCACTKPIWDAG